MGKSEGSNPPRNEGSAGGLFINHEFKVTAISSGLGVGHFSKKNCKNSESAFLEDGEPPSGCKCLGPSPPIDANNDGG